MILAQKRCLCTVKFFHDHKFEQVILHTFFMRLHIFRITVNYVLKIMFVLNELGFFYITKKTFRITIFRIRKFLVRFQLTRQIRSTELGTH